MKQEGPYVIRKSQAGRGWHYKMVDTRDKPERIVFEVDYPKPQSPPYMRHLQAKYNSSTLLTKLGV